MRPSLKNARKREKRKRVARVELLVALFLDLEHRARTDIRHVLRDPAMFVAAKREAFALLRDAHRDP